jgi:hypothetical protein
MMATRRKRPSHNIIDSRHPNYLSCMSDWQKWRLTYRGGDEFRDRYLEQFSAREERKDFNSRKAVTPIPAFAKAAVNDIRNSIYQRMSDVLRTGGSGAYQQAVAGLKGGVDRRGATMTSFLGMKVLTDLLVMGRVGVYVDHPVVEGVGTLADTTGRRPYLYSYQIEDILSWACSKPEEPSEFQSPSCEIRASTATSGPACAAPGVPSHLLSCSPCLQRCRGTHRGRLHGPDVAAQAVRTAVDCRDLLPVAGLSLGGSAGRTNRDP